MANVEVTGLKLNVTGNIADTKRKLDAVKTSLSKLKIADSKVKAINDLATGVSKFATAVNKLDVGKVDAFGGALNNLGKVEIKPSVIKRVNELGDAFKNIDVKGLGDRAAKLNSALEPLATTMQKISSSAKELGINANFGKAVARAEDAFDKKKAELSLKGVKPKEETVPEKSPLDRFRDTAKAISENIDKAFSSTAIGKAYNAVDMYRNKLAILKEEFSKTQAGKFWNELTVAANKAFAVIKNGAVKVVNAMKKIISVAGRVVSAFSKIGFLNPFKNLADTIGRVYNKLKNLTSSLARIALYRALRTAIKEVAKAVKEGLTNLYQWSKATGGDFAPAVDKLATAMLYLKNSFGAAVSPLITYFAPAIDLAVDKIVDLINVINQLFARLTGRATWTRALKYPTEFAESAAGATKKVKDNIQDFDELHILRTPSGGSGKSAEDYSKMFEETEFSKGLTEWILDFKQAIKNGRWYEAGNILADEINHMVNSINWGQLGRNLADKVNNMFSFAWGVLHNIDFVNIGSSIATFFNNAIERVDAHQIGMVLARKWTMIFDTLYGFVSTFDFPQFGWRVSELVEGWFDEIDGYQIGVTISEAIKGALDSAIAFMSNQSMIDKFAEDFAGLINGIDWYGILCRVLTIGTQVLNAISQAIETAISGGGTHALSNTAGLDRARLNASAPPAIAQRVQNEYDFNVSRGHTGTFGERFVNSMTESISSADVSGLIRAIKRLFDSVWDAVYPTLREIVIEGCTEIIADLVDAITGSHIDRNGNRVSSGSSNGNWVIGNSAYNRTQGFATAHSGTTSPSRPSTSSLSSEPGRLTAGWKGATNSANSYNKSVATIQRSTRTLADDTTRLGNTIKGVTDESKSGVAGVQSSFESFGSKISGEVVNKVIDSKNAITSAFASMKDDASNSLGSLANNAVASMQNTASAATAPLQGIKDNIVSAFRSAGDESVASIGDLSQRMSNSLGGLVEASRQQMEGYTSKWNELHSATRGVSNSVIGGAEHMANAVIDAFNSLQDATGNIKIDVPGYKFEAHNLRRLTHISIPQLATGGIATSPTTALIGEAGKEAVLPLENNTEWMNTLAERINDNGGDEVALLREQNDLLRQIAAKNVTISSREIFNAVRDENSDYITRTGKNALAFS